MDRSGSPAGVGAPDSLAIALVRENPASAERALGLLLQGGSEDRGPRADRLAALFRESTGSDDLARDVALFRRLDAPSRSRWFRARKLSLDASAFAADGEAARAAKAHGDALDLYRRVGDLRRAAETLSALGALAWARGDPAEALRADREALVASRVLGDRRRIGRSLARVAEGAVRTGDMTGGLKFSEEARRIFEEIGDREGRGGALAAMAEIALLAGRLEEAERFGEEALQDLETLPWSEALSRARGSVISVSAALGDTARALALSRSEVRSAEERSDPRAALDARRRLAAITASSGDREAALRMLSEVRRVEEARGDPAGIAAARTALGAVRLALGDADAALPDFEAAEAAGRASGRREETGLALGGIAAAEVLAGRSDRALAALGRARTWMKETPNPFGLRDVLARAAEIQGDLGRSGEALSLLHEVLALDTRHGIRTNLAADHVLHGSLLSRAGRRGEARAAFDEAIGLARRLERDDILWPAYQGIADDLERAGELDSALAVNGLAVEALSRIRPGVLPVAGALPGPGALPAARAPGAISARAGSSPGRMESPFSARIRLLARLHGRDPRGSHADEAFAIAERWKARELLDVLASGRVDAWASAGPALAAERRAVDRGLRAVDHRIRAIGAAGADTDTLAMLLSRREALLSRERELFARVRASHPRLGALDTRTAGTAAELRRGPLRRSGAVLLEYVLGDSASWLWVVTSKDTHLHRLPPRGEIASQVRIFRRALEDPSPAGDEVYLKSAHLLHRTLLAPAGRDALGKDDVFLVPDGPLHLLPFEALLERAVTRGEPARTAGRRKERASADAAKEAGRRAEFLAGLPYAFRNARVRYAATAALLLASAAESAPGAADRADGRRDGPGARGAVPPAVRAEPPDSRRDESALARPLAAFFDGAPAVLAGSIPDTAPDPGGVQPGAQSGGTRSSGAQSADTPDALLARFRTWIEKEGKPPAEALRRARADLRRNGKGGLPHPAFWARWVLVGAP